MTAASWASTASTRVVAVDARSRTLADVEHLVHRIDQVLGGGLDASSYVVTSHTVVEPDRHFALVVSWREGPERDEVARSLEAAIEGAAVVGGEDPASGAGHVAPLPGLAAAVGEHTGRRTGRLARYPGRDAIERRLTVGEVIASSCVDEVAGLAGTEVQSDSVVELTGFARPEWRAGRCVLLVQPGVDALLPFEVRQQIPCCTDH